MLRTETNRLWPIIETLKSADSSSPMFCLYTKSHLYILLIKIKESYRACHTRPCPQGTTLLPKEAAPDLTGLQILSQALEHGPTRNRHFYHLLCFASPFNP